MIVGAGVTMSVSTYRLVPVDNPVFIFTSHLRVCDLDSAPDYLWRNPSRVSRECTLRADLSTVPVSRYTTKTNSEGQKFYRVDYELVVKVQDGVCTPCAQRVIALLTCIGLSF